MELLTGIDRGESRALLARAYVDHARGNLEEASGRAWDAVALRLSAVAAARGWPSSTHRDLHAAIERLVTETGDARWRLLMASATALHTNCYEGWLPSDWVLRDLDHVAELVERLDALTP